MKRICLAFVGVLALAGAAAAADLPPAPQNYYKAPVYVPPFSWTGFYLGVNGGGAFGRSTWDSAGSFDISGGQVGGTVGYNYQAGPAVLGIEGDIDWSDISGSTAAACPARCRTDDNWLSTVRGRLGFAAGRFMPYVTAGGAFGDIRASTPGFAGDSTTNVGWTVGGGIEFAVLEHLSLKGEYLFVDLGNFNCGLGCGAASTDRVSFNASIVRGGLNYRF